MPIIKSAKKRVKVARQATIRNAKTKRNLKTAVKAFQTALKDGDKKAGEALKAAQSAIDQAAKKNVIHKNKAARKKSQLSKASLAAGITVAAGAAAKKIAGSKRAEPAKKLASGAAKKTASTAKKEVAKQAPAKKSTAKKTTTAKAPAKKSAAKKAAPKTSSK